MSETETLQLPSSLVGTQWPGVGVGVLVLREGKVLLGHRGDNHTHGRGIWSFPGGKLDFGESWEDCATREVAEEAGLEVTNVRFVAVTNDMFPDEGRHFITIFMVADAPGDDEPRVMEEGKMETWGWFDWDAMPRPLFLTIENLLKQGVFPPSNFS